MYNNHKNNSFLPCWPKVPLMLPVINNKGYIFKGYIDCQEKEVYAPREKIKNTSYSMKIVTKAKGEIFFTFTRYGRKILFKIFCLRKYAQYIIKRR